MPNYRYKAIDKGGKTVQGTSTAQSIEHLTKILEEQSLFLMESKEEGLADSSAAPAAAPMGGAVSASHPASRGVEISVAAAKATDAVTAKEVAIFTTQFSVMVRTALPILEALQMLARQQPNPAFRAVLTEIARAVQAGMPLSQAFQGYPRIFDEVYQSLLAAGEASGTLPAMLDRIADYLTFQIALREKVRSALLYPTIVVITAVGVVAFLVLFILPTFMEVFKQFEVELPFATKVLIALSDHVRALWIPYLVGVGGAWWYFSKWLSDPVHTRTVHSIQLQMPVVGTLVRNIVMTRVLRTLGALVSSGVPILKSLELARSAAGNVVFSELLAGVSSSVNQGRGLAPALAGTPYVPETVVGMIATGEKTGALPDVLNRVADFYESETDIAIKDAFAVLEPLMVVFLGSLVGGIAVAILLPIFEISKGFN